jgi:hypothetical protein
MKGCWVLVVVVLLVGACARSGGPDPETFARQADARCAEANARLEAVIWPPDDDLSLRTAAAPIAESGDIHRALVADLRAIAGNGPGRSVVAAGERLVAAYDDLEASASRGDQPAFDAALTDLVTRSDAAAEASRRLGLRTCYDAPALS